MTCHPAPTKGLVSEPFIYHKDRMVLQETCHPGYNEGFGLETFICTKQWRLL